jgi:transposase
MAKPKKPDQKTLALKRTGTLNPRPDAVADTLFKADPFFDPKDLLQVRYEMLRRHSVERSSIVEVAAKFGVSRPTVYQAQAAFEQAGLIGLLPKHRGPKQGHKLSPEVVEYVRTLRSTEPGLTTVACVQAVHARFGIRVHRRSLERALASKKKPRKLASDPPFRREPSKPTKDFAGK